MTTFPTLPARLSGLSSPTIAARQNPDGVGTIEDVLNSFSTIGPLVTRMVQIGQLESPQATITLQRNAIDVGGNPGMLSLGSYPEGVTNETFTWVPIRAYRPSDGGLPPPPDAPNEVYPIAWEVHVDGVYLDGVKLPKSNLSNPVIGTSALVDTGNSLIRGPADVVAEVYRRLGANQQKMISCTVPHTLAFEIGGVMFPVDPRDFIVPAQPGDLNSCWSNIVATDPPAKGFLYSWSLGDPFLKSAVTSFYYGNLTYPSQDPPRMGFVSTVPDNANDLFADAISNAAIDSGNFPAFSVEPPSRAPSGLAGYGNSLPTGLKAGVPVSTSSAARISTTVAPSTTDTPQTSQVAPNPAPSPSQSAKHSGASALTIDSSLWLSLIAAVASILLLGH